MDLFLHETRLKARYGYIIYDFFVVSARFAADIFILKGTHRLICKQLDTQFRKAHIWRFVGEFILIVLVIIAFYTAGSLFADQILWLQIADTSIIGDVAAREDKFEASFFIIQFLLTLAFLTSAGISLWFWKRDIGDEPLPTV